ncbi:large conductance mechanosensitive channel protein MscL [Thiobacter aerophilum]|uniref:Large-conductance mechanosensitive channel n=1 Tax=Thiobacter aerophilum TaxID=3121275 RepID=A0ABV0EDU5_9BURK
MPITQEFKEFITRGNVVDLAVGVVIGAAFGKLVNAFVKDILMPPIGMLLGGVDFAQLYIDLSGRGYPSLEAAEKAGAPILRYGAFLNAVVDFVIVAFALFLVAKFYNRVKRATPPAPASPAEDVQLLREIRDALRKD